MAELVYEEVLINSDDLKIHDEFKIADTQVIVADIGTNRYDQLVLTLGIVGATVKKRNKMTLIIPKKTPMVILK